MSTAAPSGILISFAGVDSSGKETQAKLLADRLRYTGHIVHHFETPDYNTPSGKDLKARLQNKVGDWEKTPWQEKNGFFAANRLEHRDEVIEALRKKEVVVYDRYVPSSLAFMTVEALSEEGSKVTRTEVHDHVLGLEHETNEMPREDMSIFLDVPPRVSAVLLEARKEKLEDEDEYTDHISVQERLYAEYEFLCQNDADRYARIPCIEDVRMRGIEAIGELVWQAVLERFPHVNK